MLLPSRFQPEALPTLGPAIRKPEPVKVDPIKAFEDHEASVVYKGRCWFFITEADCRQVKPRSQVIPDRFGHTHMTDCECFECKPTFSLDLGSGEVKVEEPKFRVGDRVCHTLSSQLRFAVHSIEKNDHGTWVRCIREGEAQPVYTYKERDLELIPSPPTSDGWNGELVVGKVYLTRPEHSEKECFFSRWEGWWMFDSRCAREAVLSDRVRYTQKRTVIREATEAELRGES